MSDLDQLTKLKSFAKLKFVQDMSEAFSQENIVELIAQVRSNLDWLKSDLQRADARLRQEANVVALRENDFSIYAGKLTALIEALETLLRILEASHEKP